MADVNEQLTVTRNDEKGRYEIHVGDELGGFATFHGDSRGRVIFPETQVDPAFEGRGLGSRLVGEALADAAQRGATVVPVCPFVQKYLGKNDVPDLKVEWPTEGEGPRE